MPRPVTKKKQPKTPPLANLNNPRDRTIARAMNSLANLRIPV